MQTLDNVTTGNDYSVANTIVLPTARVLALVVANAGIWARFKRHDPSGRNNELEWGEEVLLLPTEKVWDNVSGFSCRSAVANVPAQVVAQLFEPGDPQPQTAAPFTQYLAASNAVSSTLAMQTGDIFWSAVATARGGTVPCDGTHYNSVTDPTFANLYNQLGLVYGGTSAADFAVPDLRGRVAVMQGTHADVAARGNNEGALIGDRRPKHKHPIPGNLLGAKAGVSGSPSGAATQDQAAIEVGPQTNAPIDAPAYLVLNAFIVK